MPCNGYSDADVVRVRVALLRRAGRPLDSNERPYDAWGDVMKAEESYFDQLARAALDAMTPALPGFLASSQEENDG